LPGLAYADLPAHPAGDSQAERSLLQELCARERIALFAATGRLFPAATPSVLMIPGTCPEDPADPEPEAALGACAAVLATQDAAAQDLVHRYAHLAPDRVAITPYGTTLHTASDDRVAGFRSRHGIDRPYYLLIEGGSGPRPAAFLQAFARLGEARSGLAIVITPGSAPLAPETTLYLGEASVYRIDLDDQDLACAYSGALALVDTRCEGSGLTVLEAMACSCPVLSWGATHTGDTADDAMLQVAGEDEAELHEALLAVRQEPLRGDLIRKGLAHSSAFTLRRMADSVEAALTRWAGK
jgi:hypothetical protein